MVEKLLNKKAKFDSVVKDIEALEWHYKRFTLGDRDGLARECCHYVEMAIQREESWAKNLKARVYKKND